MWNQNFYFSYNLTDRVTSNTTAHVSLVTQPVFKLGKSLHPECDLLGSISGTLITNAVLC